MLKDLVKRYPQLEPLSDTLEDAVDLMQKTYLLGGKILLCGNGGSCADCDHIVGELMKGFRSLRRLSTSEAEKFVGLCENPELFAKKLQKAVPAISLASQCAVLTAFMNDVDPSLVYAQLTYGYGTKNDLLIALSTSGNSQNVVNAAIAAKAIGMKTLCMTGANESRLSSLCDCAIRVPETETYKVQELHLPIYHYLCAELEERLFAE